MAYWKIFTVDGEKKAESLYVEDAGNKGLPDWFFEGGYTGFQVDPRADTVSWVPACGPAPCWDRKLSEFADDAEMFAAFKAWIDQSY